MRARRLHGDRLDRGQGVLHPVVQFVDHQFLAFGGQDGVGDVMPLDEDAHDRAGVVADRLVDEVQIARRQQAVGRLLQLHGTLSPLAGLARRQHLVEKIIEALTRQFRQGLADGLSDHVAMADQLTIGAVVQLDHVLRAVQHGDEARRLHEHVQQLSPLRLQPPIVRLNAHGATEHAAADQAVQSRGWVRGPKPPDLTT
ncbi:hypothetical protein D3C86_1565240 [compost metagenome]